VGKAAPAICVAEYPPGGFAPESCFAVCPGDRLALKIGQLAVAQGAFEVIANRPIVIANIARPVQRPGRRIVSGRRSLVKKRRVYSPSQSSSTPRSLPREWRSKNESDLPCRWCLMFWSNGMMAPVG